MHIVMVVHCQQLRLAIHQTIQQIPSKIHVASLAGLDECQQWLDATEPDWFIVDEGWAKHELDHILLQNLATEKTVYIGKKRRNDVKFNLKPQQIQHLTNLLCHKSKNETRFSKHVWCRDGHRYQLISLQNVVLFGRAERYTSLNLDGETYLSDKTLNDWESILCPKQFFRINRGNIVNRKNILRVSEEKHGGFTLSLSNGMQAKVSRAKSMGFLQWSENQNQEVASF